MAEYIVVNDVLPPRHASYGRSEPFAQGSRLRYPDFDLMYVGSEIDGARREWRFSVHAGGTTVAVALVTGGVVEPAHARVGDVTFASDIDRRDRDESRIVVRRA